MNDRSSIKSYYSSGSMHLHMLNGQSANGGFQYSGQPAPQSFHHSLHNGQVLGSASNGHVSQQMGSFGHNQNSTLGPPQLSINTASSLNNLNLLHQHYGSAPQVPRSFSTGLPSPTLSAPSPIYYRSASSYSGQSSSSANGSSANGLSSNGSSTSTASGSGKSSPVYSLQPRSVPDRYHRRKSTSSLSAVITTSATLAALADDTSISTSNSASAHHSSVSSAHQLTSSASSNNYNLTYQQPFIHPSSSPSPTSSINNNQESSSNSSSSSAIASNMNANSNTTTNTQRHSKTFNESK